MDWTSTSSPLCLGLVYPYEIEMFAADLQRVCRRPAANNYVCKEGIFLFASVCSSWQAHCKHWFCLLRTCSKLAKTDLDRKEVATEINVCIMFATTLQ